MELVVEQRQGAEVLEERDADEHLDEQEEEEGFVPIRRAGGGTAGVRIVLLRLPARQAHPQHAGRCHAGEAVHVEQASVAHRGDDEAPDGRPQAESQVDRQPDQ